MGQMTAMRKIHAENGVTRLELRKIGRHIGLCTRVRLYIDMLSTKNSLGPLNSELFNHVDVFTTTIVASPGVSFCIFVSQHGVLRFEDGFTDDVFRSNQFEVIFLSFGLVLNSSVH